jgi:hypothetical protein
MKNLSRSVAAILNYSNCRLRDTDDPERASGASIFFVALDRELVGVDDVRGLLALADCGAQLERLPEGEPGVRRKAVSFGAVPEDRNVDALVVLLRRDVGRKQCDGVAGLPWFEPRRDAALEVRNDGVGDLLIKSSDLHLLSKLRPSNDWPEKREEQRALSHAVAGSPIDSARTFMVCSRAWTYYNVVEVAKSGDRLVATADNSRSRAPHSIQRLQRGRLQ